MNDFWSRFECEFFSSYQVIRKMGQYLKMNVVVPEEYVEGFVRANNTFLYQLVFDPAMRKVVPLNPYPQRIDPDSLNYAGMYPLVLQHTSKHFP